jgi:hypothetical protein
MFDEQPDGDIHGECAAEIDRLRDEVEYHKKDAKKWAIQAAKFDKWHPISTAPKDGTYILVGNADGVWMAYYMGIYPSGFKAPNPWQSLMLNHRHMERKNRSYSSEPTHWMPIPKAPRYMSTEKDNGHG